MTGPLFAGSPAIGLKACSSPGALSAPSPEGAPRGVLGTSAEGTVWISATTARLCGDRGTELEGLVSSGRGATGAFRDVGQIVSGGTGSGSVGGLGSGGGSGSGPGIGGVGEGGSGVSFGMGRVCPRRLLRKRGRLRLSDQILALSARRGWSSRRRSFRYPAQRTSRAGDHCSTSEVPHLPRGEPLDPCGSDGRPAHERNRERLPP